MASRAKLGSHTAALFTLNYSHPHHNAIEHGCEAISGNFAVTARNCLTFTLKRTAMQIRKPNCEKGYCIRWKYKPLSLLLKKVKFYLFRESEVYLSQIISRQLNFEENLTKKKSKRLLAV